MGSLNGKRVIVLGAGTMGASIALVFARGGADVWITARSQQSLERCRGQIQTAARELDESSNLESLMNHITLVTDARQFLEAADLVVETIREDLGDKQQILREVNDAAPRSALVVSNTSSLNLDEVFFRVNAPERTAGLHWFNPAHLIPLVEVVRTSHTSDETVQTLTAWMNELGKVGVVVEHAVQGFIANRLQYALLREAYALVQAGVCSADDIDRAVTSSIGARWAAIGPFASMDLAGLDVHLAVATTLFPTLATDQSAPTTLVDLVEAGSLGCKSGDGLLGRYPSDRQDELRKRLVRSLKAAADST